MTCTDAVDSQTLEKVMLSLACQAGKVILSIRDSGVDVDIKDDASPVTEADRRAEIIINEGLRRYFPEIFIVAEEESAAGFTQQHSDLFFLVDPLDGTKEFISGRSDFTVNIALIENGIPVIGCVYAPALGELFFGALGFSYLQRVENNELTGNKTPLKTCSHEPRKIVASRSHLSPETKEYIAQFDGAELLSAGSSLKFCLVARGSADLYPRFSPTMEWDTAAGDAVLRNAGGMTRGLNGAPLQYGNKNTSTPRDYENTHFVASAS